MSNDKFKGWIALIKAIKEPMGFLVFIVLLTESTMSLFALKNPSMAPGLVAAMCVVFVLFGLVVVVVSTFRPGVLQGKPLAPASFSSHADHFGLEIYAALDGALSNLGKAEREEAWAVIAEVLEEAPHADAEYLKFRIGVAQRLRLQTSLINRTLQSRGVITPPNS